MATCPVCNTPGAYIGFSSVECRNPDCEHFTIEEDKICPCCGKVGHIPSDSKDAADANQMIGSIQIPTTGGDPDDSDDSAGPCTI